MNLESAVQAQQQQHHHHYHQPQRGACRRLQCSRPSVTSDVAASDSQLAHCQPMARKVYTSSDRQQLERHQSQQQDNNSNRSDRKEEEEKENLVDAERRAHLSLSDDEESEQVITSLQMNSKKVPLLTSQQSTSSSNRKQQQPITNTSSSLPPNPLPPPSTNNASSLVKRTATNRSGQESQSMVIQVEAHNEKENRNQISEWRVLDPSGSLYYHWSMVVSFAFLYNFWSLSYRFAFREIDFDTVALWFALDYSADLIYIMDVLINSRTGYLEDGVLQRNRDKIAQHYRECTLFYLDCFCLLPLDILYLSIGFNSILRCTRLFKIYKFWSYVDRTERHTNYPNVFRTFTLVHYILVIFHWNACLFHMISKNKVIDIEDLYKINDNRCHDVLCQYLHAFYWSILALTTIGDLPRPRTKGEYLYVIVELFFGLFLFASVLGHVANIVTNVSTARKEFQAKLDAVKTFMRMRHVSDDLQSKVIRWFDYLWVSQEASDEEKSVACLPDRLKAEIAIHVHLDTLKRVDIFQNTEAGFLCELVLRLKPVLFSPGDYVCRKNEVGHEMYIVSRGILEVVTDQGKTVVATLKAGSYFGEISVLNVGLAGNKRTASVRSVGYSDLFCLNKQDLWDVLKNYPNAEARIRARAEERLNKLDINRGSENARSQLNDSKNLIPDNCDQIKKSEYSSVRPRLTGRSCSVRCRKTQVSSQKQQSFCKRRHQLAPHHLQNGNGRDQLLQKPYNCCSQSAFFDQKLNKSTGRVGLGKEHDTQYCCSQVATNSGLINSSVYACSRSLDRRYQSAILSHETNFSRNAHDSSHESSTEELNSLCRPSGETEEDWPPTLVSYQHDNQHNHRKATCFPNRKQSNMLTQNSSKRCRSHLESFERAESADGAMPLRRETTNINTSLTTNIGPHHSSTSSSAHQRVMCTDYLDMQNQQQPQNHHERHYLTSNVSRNKISSHSRLSSNSGDSSCPNVTNNYYHNTGSSTSRSHASHQPINATRSFQSHYHQHYCDALRESGDEDESSLILFQSAKSQAASSSRRSSRRRRQPHSHQWSSNFNESSDVDSARKQFHHQHHQHNQQVEDKQHLSCNDSQCKTCLSCTPLNAVYGEPTSSSSGFWAASPHQTATPNRPTIRDAPIIQLPISATPDPLNDSSGGGGLQMLSAIQLPQSAQSVSLSHLNLLPQQTSPDQRAQAALGLASPMPISPIALDPTSLRLQPQFLFVCQKPDSSGASAQSTKVSGIQQEQEQQPGYSLPSTNITTRRAQVKESTSLWCTGNSRGVNLDATSSDSLDIRQRTSSVSICHHNSSAPLEELTTLNVNVHQQQQHENKENLNRNQVDKGEK